MSCSSSHHYSRLNGAGGWRCWGHRWGQTGCHHSDIIPVPPQLPYTELEKVSGIEEAKHYLRQKLRELRF